MTNIGVSISIYPTASTRNITVPVAEIIMVDLSPTGTTNGFINVGTANLTSSIQYTIVVQQETGGAWNLDSVSIIFCVFFVMRIQMYVHGSVHQTLSQRDPYIVHVCASFLHLSNSYCTPPHNRLF